MLLRSLLITALSLTVVAQDQTGLQIDFLGSYYDQDGENSPVNGGIGSEALTSTSPVFILNYGAQNGWSYSATIGVDNVSSASIDSMDDNRPATFNYLRDDEYEDDHDGVSSASRMDNRAFFSGSAAKTFGAHTFNFNVGFSKEYDYKSVNAGIGYALDFNQKNTTLGAVIHHYADDVDLYDIHGIDQGSDARDTTDVSLSLTQILGKKTVGSIEFFRSEQSGFLSSPFQEVILNDGTHVAERLPDERTRNGIALKLNHAFNPNLIQRSSLRFYDDNFGIQATSLELETHFKMGSNNRWLYPILRYHDQTGSDYFYLPEAASPDTPFYTADRDLSGFTSMKYGVGWQTDVSWGPFTRFDVRATYYDRDDGLTAFNLSFGLRWGRR